MSRAAATESLEDGLARLERVNGVSRRELDDAVFNMRAAKWARWREFMTTAEILHALAIGFAATDARLELAEEQATRATGTP